MNIEIILVSIILTIIIIIIIIISPNLHLLSLILSVYGVRLVLLLFLFWGSLFDIDIGWVYHFVIVDFVANGLNLRFAFLIFV